MRILKSYLNEIKQPGLAKAVRNSLSNKMLKYIVGSCFKKMSRRAFHWSSCSMIKNLTDLTWDFVDEFIPVSVKTDRRLSEFLRLKNPEGSNNQTFGDWLMVSFNPSQSPVSLDDFLTLASGSNATYDFDWNIAAIFHSLLLSSLYFYL